MLLWTGLGERAIAAAARLYLREALREPKLLLVRPALQCTRARAPGEACSTF